jgi:hypothetical protein
MCMCVVGIRADGLGSLSTSLGVNVCTHICVYMHALVYEQVVPHCGPVLEESHVGLVRPGYIHCVRILVISLPKIPYLLRIYKYI